AGQQQVLAGFQELEMRGAFLLPDGLMARLVEGLDNVGHGEPAGQMAEGWRARAVTWMSMYGNSGSDDSNWCSASLLSTSKTLTLAWRPATRHRWRHVPSRCSCWARAFSSALSLSARSAGMSAGRLTCIWTRYSMAHLRQGVSGQTEGAGR